MSSIFVAGAALESRRVACFFGGLYVRATSNGDNVQIAWQAWHFVTCDEIDGSLARKIDFEVADFGFH